MFLFSHHSEKCIFAVFSRISIRKQVQVTCLNKHSLAFGIMNSATFRIIMQSMLIVFTYRLGYMIKCHHRCLFCMCCTSLLGHCNMSPYFALQKTFNFLTNIALFERWFWCKLIHWYFSPIKLVFWVDRQTHRIV